MKFILYINFARRSPPNYNLEPNREYLINRESLTDTNLRLYSEQPNEISIHVYTDTASLKVGEKDMVAHIAKFGAQSLYMPHSHVSEESGDQPSIKDLDSAELNQICANNPQLRFYIFTKTGISEYWLPDEIVKVLKTSGEEFRNFYLRWHKSKYGGNKPDGRQVSNDFNSEFSTFSYFPWGSKEANEAIERIRGEK